MYCQMWVATGMLVTDIDERCYKVLPNGSYFTSIVLSVRSHTMSKLEPYHYIRVGFVGIPAKFIIEYCSKHDIVMVTGHVKEVKYDLSDGSKTYRTKVYGRTIRTIHSPKDKPDRVLPWETSDDRGNTFPASEGVDLFEAM